MSSQQADEVAVQAEDQPERTAQDDEVTVAERVTVSLIPRTVRELRTLQDQTTMSRSDLVNRAMSLYAFVNKQLDAGGELAIHYPGSGETQIVHLA